MFFAIHIMALVFSLAQDSLPTVPDLVKKLYAPRKGITLFEVVIHARNGEGKAKPHIRRIWRDGDRYRFDHLNDFANFGSARHTDCTNCPEPGKYFFVHYDREFDPSKAASMMPLATRRVIGGDRRFRFEDLGTTPEPLVNQAHERGIEWYLGLVGETEKLLKGAETRVERIRWRGRSAFKIVLTGANLPRKPTYEVTLLPDFGYAAVSAKSTWEANGRASVETSECELAKVSGIWLPTTSVYRKYADGKEIARLNQNIEYVRINESPDPKVFTLRGMDLIPGTLVGTENGTVKWDGKKLVPATELRLLPPQQNQEEVEQSRSQSRRILFYAIAAGLVLASGLFVIRLISTFRVSRTAPLASDATTTAASAPPQSE